VAMGALPAERADVGVVDLELKVAPEVAEAWVKARVSVAAE